MIATPQDEGQWKQLIFLPRLIYAVPPKKGADGGGKASQHDVIHARIRQAWAGDWAFLWAATARPTESHAKPKGQPKRTPQQVAEATMKRIHDLIGAGEMSRATAAVGGTSKIAMGDEAIEGLKKLFPKTRDRHHAGIKQSDEAWI